MADLADVEEALLSGAYTALFPGGVLDTRVPASSVRLYRGWPVAAALDLDLAAGIPQVTVVPKAHTSRLTTRWPVEVRAQGTACPLTSIASNNAVTFSGGAGSGILAGVLVDRLTYAYRCQNGDTPALVAASLAEQARADTVVWLSGTTLTFPLASLVVGRAYADYLTSTEFRRQRQGFSVILWCPDPTSRDALAGIVDGAYAQLAFLSLSDGTVGHLRYLSTTSYDQSEDSTLYRRDLNYVVDYPTTVQSTASSMLFGDTNFNSTRYFA